MQLKAFKSKTTGYFRPCSTIAYNLMKLEDLKLLNQGKYDCYDENICLLLYDLNVDRYLVLNATLYDWVALLESPEGSCKGLPDNLSLQEQEVLTSTSINDNWIELVHV